MKTKFDSIPFNKPYFNFKKNNYLKEVLRSNKHAGNGKFTKRCNEWLIKNIKVKKSLITHSCTASLEMAAMLLKIKHGDEIIMPSYSFVSTANAFVLRGGVPVFIDIRKDTLNIDESKIEQAITKKTKAIVVLHYAGVSCDMEKIIKIAKKFNIYIVEDAAHSFLSEYKGSKLGTIGDIGTFSFHETKNISSGEGGALLLNKKIFFNRSEILHEKGTNRSQFLKGAVNKYTWLDIGSSYLPNEITSSILYSQLVDSKKITKERVKVWNIYHQAFKEIESQNLASRPSVPKNCKINGHIYYLILKSEKERDLFIKLMNKENIMCASHYIPLHNTKGGIKFGRKCGTVNISESFSKRIVRLPLWHGIINNIEEISDKTISIISKISKN